MRKGARLAMVVLATVLVLALVALADAMWQSEWRPREERSDVADVTDHVVPSATVTEILPTLPPFKGVPTVGTAELREPSPTPTETPPWADVFFDAQRFSYAHNFAVPEMMSLFAEHGSILSERQFQIGGRTQSFAETLVGLSSLYSINPKIVLALMEQQSGIITAHTPSDEQLTWAMGFRPDGGGGGGFYAQLSWAVIELRIALRDYAIAARSGQAPPELTFSDGTRQAVAADISLPKYAISRVLAKTTTPEHLPEALRQFQKTYTRLFDDPRTPPDDWPEPSEPFLRLPMAEPARVTSFFDHDLPLLQPNGATEGFWGYASAALSYDGHTGWDYAMRPPDEILAAADGVVTFAGHSDDGCATAARGVIIDHGNGYRTLYWHLHSIAVELGQVVAAGDVLGVAGDSGCAFGPHLHLQVQYLGRDIDPYGWCGKGDGTWGENPAGQISHWLWTDMPNPCGDISDDPDIIVVDDTMPGFSTNGEWQQSGYGYGGSAQFLASVREPSKATPWGIRPFRETPVVATWQPTLPETGDYRVRAYIPYVLNGLDDSKSLRYHVFHEGGSTLVLIDGEVLANGWADLGTYRFRANGSALVGLSAMTGDAGRGVWADAVIWERVR